MVYLIIISEATFINLPSSTMFYKWTCILYCCCHWLPHLSIWQDQILQTEEDVELETWKIIFSEESKWQAKEAEWA